MSETLQAIRDFIVKVWTTELFGPDTVTIGGILILGGLWTAHRLGWPADWAVMVYAGGLIVIYAVLFVLAKTAIDHRVRQGASVAG